MDFFGKFPSDLTCLSINLRLCKFAKVAWPNNKACQMTISSK